MVLWFCDLMFCYAGHVKTQMSQFVFIQGLSWTGLLSLCLDWTFPECKSLKFWLSLTLISSALKFTSTSGFSLQECLTQYFVSQSFKICMFLFAWLVLVLLQLELKTSFLTTTEHYLQPQIYMSWGSERLCSPKMPRHCDTNFLSSAF